MEPYYKPYFIAVGIKYIKSAEPIMFMKNANNKNKFKKQNQDKIYLNTFRISKTTTFQHLKCQAAEFWVFLIKISFLFKILQEVPLNTLIEKEKENEETKESEKDIKKKKKVEKYDNYELVDENYNDIPTPGLHSSTVESFFQGKGSEFARALLILRKKETLIDVIKNDDNEKGKDKYQSQFSRIHTEEDDLYNEFYKRFPGMKV